MEIKKLKYLLRNQTVSLLVNVAAFTALLSLAALRSWFFGLLWIIDILYLKAKFFKNEAIKPTFLFWTFCILSFFLLWTLTGNAALVSGLLISILLFIFIGAQVFYFSSHKTALAIFFHMTVFGVVSVFAAYSPSDLWWGALIALGAVLFGITLDFLKIETNGVDIRKKTYALVFAFIAAQCAWVASLLPLGFLNVGTLVLVFSIVAGEVAVGHFTGRLNRKMILRHALFFAGFATLIFLVGMA